ncbi:MAG: RNA-binding S4 domain-containing protein [Oscillospiraceae bacterium]|jgi:ribosomal 50S subunit-recycling heat shock protein|nr:RNA-binding S4 domain-containing protein [Oscillospiraceae bacterium]
MRLDKYLKVSRIVKRRTVANELCDAGHVDVNDRRARASYEVKIGDVIGIRMGQTLRKYEVLRVAEYAKKEDAGDLFRIVGTGTTEFSQKNV